MDNVLRLPRAAALAGWVLALATHGAYAAPVAPAPPLAAATIDTVLSPRIAMAIHAAFDAGRVSRAESLLAAWDREALGDPLPALVSLQLAWWDVLEGRDRDGARDHAFASALSTVDSLSATRLHADPNDAAALWAYGEAHCAAGRLAGLRGQAWSALRHHQRGVAALEAVRRLRPNAAEPRGSLGVFRYYTARLPGPVRVVARLVRVRGDRAGGLSDLRAAAAGAGIHQVAARFFLAQILNDAECENWEALEQCIRARRQAPARIAIVLKWADVVADLDRPDVAVDALEAIAGAPGHDACTRVQARFLAGRVESESGRDAVARARFEAMRETEVAEVRWLEPWWHVYRGVTHAAMGDAATARRHWRRVAALPDIAGSRQAAADHAARFASPLESLRRRAAAARLGQDDAAGAWAAWRAAAAERDTHSAPAPAAVGAAFDLAGACAALGAGDAAAAIPLAERAAATAAGCDDLALATAARVRWLQALLWRGETRTARDVAAEFRRTLSASDRPRVLEWLIATTLEPSAPDFAAFMHASLANAAGAPLAAGAGAAVTGVPMRVRLADTGFTAVDLELALDAGTVLVPLAFEAGAWRGVARVSPGRVRYRFRVEGRTPLLDPAAHELDDVQSEPWSLREVAPPAY